MNYLYVNISFKNLLNLRAKELNESLYRINTHIPLQENDNIDLLITAYLESIDQRYVAMRFKKYYDLDIENYFVKNVNTNTIDFYGEKLLNDINYKIHELNNNLF